MEPTSLIILALPLLILLGIAIVMWFVKRNLNDAVDQVLDQMMTQLSAAQQVSETDLRKVSLELNQHRDETSLMLKELSSDVMATREDVDNLKNGIETAHQKHDMAQSEFASGLTLMEANLGDRFKEQKKLLDTFGARLGSNDALDGLQTRVEAMGNGIRKLAEAQQKLTSGMSAHLGELAKDAATLKKAASAQLARLKAIEEAAASEPEADDSLAPLQASIENNHTMIQAVLDQISALSLMMADPAVDDSQEQQALTEQKALIERLEALVRDSSGLLAEDIKSQSGQLAEVLELGKTTLALAENMHTGQVDASLFEQSMSKLSEDSLSVSETVRTLLDDLKENHLSLAQQGQASEDASQNLSQELETSAEALMEAIGAQRTEMRDRIEEVSMFFADEFDGLQRTQKEMQKQQQQLRDLMTLLKGQRIASLAIAENVGSAQVASADASEDKIRIETPDFVQYLSHARIERIEDKTTGEVTLFEYTDGLKSSSETYVNDVLRYRWMFNRYGQIIQSVEFDEQGFEVEECDYNSQGEVVSRRSSKPQVNTTADIGAGGLSFPN